mgnify:CR=1 FL=1
MNFLRSLIFILSQGSYQVKRKYLFYFLISLFFIKTSAFASSSEIKQGQREDNYLQQVMSGKQVFNEDIFKSIFYKFGQIQESLFEKNKAKICLELNQPLEVFLSNEGAFPWNKTYGWLYMTGAAPLFFKVWLDQSKKNIVFELEFCLDKTLPCYSKNLLIDADFVLTHSRRVILKVLERGLRA